LLQVKQHHAFASIAEPTWTLRHASDGQSARAMPNDLAIIRQDLVMLSPFEATIGSGNKGQPGFDSTLWPWDGPPLWEGSRASNKSIVQRTNSGLQTNSGQQTTDTQQTNKRLASMKTPK
jgi:hypothetical protein